MAKTAQRGRRGKAPVATQRKSVRRAKTKAAAVAAGETKAPRGPCVVGIGASAGGFEATAALLEGIPRGAGVAVVVVQHMDPHHKSVAADLFARRTQLTVHEASDGVRIESDHAYTVPPGCVASVQNGKLRLQHLERSGGLPLPIDRFFRSLGAALKEKAIGVVLSGTGSDGSVGIKAIVANGGIALVQDPETAQHDGMPRSAVATGIVTQILPIERIAAEVVDYAAHPYARGDLSEIEREVERTRALESILDTLRHQCAKEFGGYKRTTLLRRIERRMGLRRIKSMSEYAALIRGDAAELNALAKDMFIGVTEFFRDPEAWDTLARDVIEPLVKSRSDREAIRAWVPGTSTGEEAYTLAMLILEALDRAGKQCPVHVFATDANSDALAVARIGRYPAGIVEQVSPGRLRRYFTWMADSLQYQVTPELRNCVVFGPQDVFSDPPFSRVDVVSCRNLLIYLDQAAQRKIIQLFHFALRPNAHLFLGTAESIGNRDDLFKCVSKPWQIYRRIGSSSSRQVDLLVHAAKRGSVATLAPIEGQLQRKSQLEEIAQRTILDLYAPASILVDEKHQALYFAGNLDRYIKTPRGQPTRDVLALVRDGLRSHVRAALKSASEHEAVTVSKVVRIQRGRLTVPVMIAVTPLVRTGEFGRLYLVAFVDEIVAGPAAKRRRGARNENLVDQLEDELRVTRADLHTTAHQLEAYGQELLASRQDRTAADEELRAINEELESSTEELRSLNEELHTVNQQLQSKVAELETANNDLTNLLASSEIITICLDRDLCIRWSSPRAAETINILPGDVGRPIQVFGSRLIGHAVVDAARTVMKSLAPAEAEVQGSEGRWYLRRILPYRTETSAADGVIVTLTDISASKQAGAELRTAMSLAEERERRAVAADLHDDLSQVLALVKVKTEMLIKKTADEQQRAALGEIAALSGTAHDRVRSLVFQLSPPVLNELGLRAGLSWLADEMKRLYGLTVNVVNSEAVQTVDSTAAIIVFRAVRELLINVARHAKVPRADVTCRRFERNLQISVTDGGDGFDVNETMGAAAAKGHLGLTLSRERIDAIGGSLVLHSIPGDGTEATITIPLQST